MLEFLFAAFSVLSVTALGTPARAEDPMSFFEEARCEDCSCKDDMTRITFEAGCQARDEQA